MRKAVRARVGQLWPINSNQCTLNQPSVCNLKNVCFFKAEFFILIYIYIEQTFQWPTSLRKLMCVWNIEGWVYLASFVSKVLAARTSHIWVAKFKLQYFVTSIFKHFRSRNCYLNVHNRVVLHVKNITCLQLSQPIQSMKV